jgi:hypothetical protein
MNDLNYCGNVTMELWEDMLEGKQLHRRYFKSDCGGQLSSKMINIMPGLVMFVNELGSHR